MGCNAIRMSHNPHMAELYELCDSMGFLVEDEAFDEWEGFKNKWTRGHNVYPPAHYGYAEDFPQWHEIDLANMVKRGRNHPSIIIWSIGNEIDYPNDPYCHPLFESMTGNNDANKPAAERIYDPNKPNTERLTTIAKKLYAIVKENDPSRPVTAALAFPELTQHTGLAGVLDIVGYNYKEHLYTDDHNKYPKQVILGSENGKDLKQWLAVTSNDFIAGQFLWTGIDYLGETRGWPCHGSEAGLLDTAGFEKPIYYHRKSLWSKDVTVKLYSFRLEDCPVNERMIYSRVLTRYWNYNDGDMVGVICFSNSPDVNLYLNDRKIDSTPIQQDGYKIWQIPFASGELKVLTNGNEAATDSLYTTGRAVRLHATVSNEIINAEIYDIAHVEIYALDNNGNKDTRCNDFITVELEDPGVILGIDNGDQWDSSAYSKSGRRMKNGRLLVYIGSNGERGIIHFKAKADFMKLIEIKICVR
jgi:hypothetical protein